MGTHPGLSGQGLVEHHRKRPAIESGRNLEPYSTKLNRHCARRHSRPFAGFRLGRPKHARERKAVGCVRVSPRWSCRFSRASGVLLAQLRRPFPHLLRRVAPHFGELHRAQPARSLLGDSLAPFACPCHTHKIASSSRLAKDGISTADTWKSRFPPLCKVNTTSKNRSGSIRACYSLVTFTIP